MGKKKRLTHKQEKIIRSRKGNALKRREKMRIRKIAERSKGKGNTWSSSRTRRGIREVSVSLPKAKELEQSLCQLVGVEEARVVVEDNQIKEIHVVTDPIYFAKHIAQDVRTLLIVEHGIFLRPSTKICVAQIEGIEARKRAFLRDQKGL